MTCAAEYKESKRDFMEESRNLGGRERERNNERNFPKKALSFAAAALSTCENVNMLLRFERKFFKCLAKENEERETRESLRRIKNIFLQLGSYFFFGIKLFVQRAPIDSRKTIAVA